MIPIPYFDAHCDTIAACAMDGRPLRRNSGHLDLLRLGHFRKAAQVFALFADRDRFPPGELFSQCKKLHHTFRRELAANGDILAFCPGGMGISEASADGKVIALLSIEGGELLDCDPANLELAKSWGVRCVNITWNHKNALAGSHLDSPEQGLTDVGRAWLKESQRLSILTDVSHLSDRAFWDLVDITEQPILATHSNSRTVCPHSRNLTDDMFKAICQTGGVAGINFYQPFLGGQSMNHLLRHIDHFMALDGEKHLALGGDLDGCDTLAGGIRGAEDIPLLWDALKAHGYDDNTLEDLFYNNLQRVLETG